MDQNVVPTHIVEVTVYSDRARVRRSGKVSVDAGRQQLVIEDLPRGIDDASVSVDVEGARVLSIEVDEVFGKEVSDEDAEALLDQSEAMGREMLAINDQLVALQNEQQFLQSISVDPPENDEGTAQPIALAPAQWKDTLDFVTNGMKDVRARSVAKKREKTDKQRELNAVKTEYNKALRYQSESRKRVIVEVQTEDKAACEATVTYAIHGPYWRPSYDVRVDATGSVELMTYAVVRQTTGEDWDETRMRFSTAAPQVGAELPDLLAWRLGDQDQYSMASASGELGAMGAGAADRAPTAEPQQAPMKKGRKQSRSRREMAKSAPASPPPPPAPSTTAPMPSSKAGSVGGPMDDGGMPSEIYASSEIRDDFDDDYADAPMEPEPDRTVEDERRSDEATRRRVPIAIRSVGKGVWSLPTGTKLNFQMHTGGFTWSDHILYCPSPQYAAGGFDYLYEADVLETVASDGRESRIRVAIAHFDTELVHEVVAPLAEKAYLRATVKNDTGRPLLAAESFIFLDDDFIGRAFIDTVAPTEKLDLSLGVDEDVKVDRRVEQKAVTTGLIAKKQETSYTVKVTVQSFKRRNVSVLVRDQVPLTWQKDDIEVEVGKITPDPVKKPDRGMYEWRLTLEPSSKRSVELAYKVERPRDFVLVEERQYE